MSIEIFKSLLRRADGMSKLRNSVIGDGVKIPGLFGDVTLTYADYVASGRALTLVEDFIRDHVLPFYANSHTEASYCGAYMTRMRAQARAEITRITRADDCSVIFAGAGATAGLNRLVSLFGVNKTRKSVVFIGPYEHHSNILPWRESAAKVVEIPESPTGGPDLAALEAALVTHADAEVKIGSFSAASNVTGVITDPDPVTRLLKAHGALSVWDYAGGAPYLPIDMAPAPDCQKDAVVVSPHKFPGGPGASGLLIVRDAAVRCHAPSLPGGGTVSFVSPWKHSYSDTLATREEAGTPNVVGDIRAALAFLVKEAVGQERISAREADLNEMAITGWADNPQLVLLGTDHPNRLPIFSFLVKRADGRPFHHQLFTRMLSDVYGIQVRGGCACAGPYAHALLGIDQTGSDALFCALQQGHELEKPGWVRLNFSYLMSDEKARYVIDSVNTLTHRLDELEGFYKADPATARFAISTRPETIPQGA
ncbi:aminotransferase class V-fold PLP-dependent enzyme [Aliiroseovarius crassostreae]|uniref:aminotransferase class V-fold PLP-dependent enzyme n=1 Tax=Aliiroseovarius crassostreae TaxID=154981 RepID=UPI002208140C|nr:aminotransferase class V-fold PLP-dependent enzyme [Aliiroseovarius crassostreae]UWQ12176.1 aminotransferase class V-fold PLP-dependent enzyme [Aliiroseovarius crassostreae]